MEEFTIKNKLTKSDYKKIQLKLTYSKIWPISISVFAILFVIFSLIMPLIHHNEIFYSDWYALGLVISAVAIFAPLFVLLFSGIGYRLNQRLHESIAYHFTEQGIEITGESFTTTFNWAKVYKVSIRRSWLLIYHNWFVANAIKIGTEETTKAIQLKEYLKTQGLKIKLK